MRADYPLPRLWLLSDERNDKVLEHALRKLPRGSGFIFRHYHLSPRERLARYRALRRLAKARAAFQADFPNAGPIRLRATWGGMIDTMPDVLQPIARHQPINPLVESIRGLLVGSGEAPLAVSLAWCLGILVVAAVLIVWGFRRSRDR